MSFVYFIQHGREPLFKVGFSANPLRRLAALQTASPVPLTLKQTIETEFAKELEGFLHRDLADRRRPEGEWFSLKDDEFDQALTRANTWLADYEEVRRETDRLKSLKSDSLEIQPSAEITNLHRELLSLKSQIGRLTAQKQYLEDCLRVAIGTHAGIQGVATWKTSSRTSVDVDRLKRELPQVYEDYKRVTVARTLLLKKGVDDEE